jgi:hypothetical protein
MDPSGANSSRRAGGLLSDQAEMKRGAHAVIAGFTEVIIGRNVALPDADMG